MTCPRCGYYQYYGHGEYYTTPFYPYYPSNTPFYPFVNNLPYLQGSFTATNARQDNVNGLLQIQKCEH